MTFSGHDDSTINIVLGLLLLLLLLLGVHWTVTVLRHERPRRVAVCHLIGSPSRKWPDGWNLLRLLTVTLTQTLAYPNPCSNFCDGEFWDGGPLHLGGCMPSTECHSSLSNCSEKNT